MKNCKVKDCQRPFYGISWCRLHLRRWRKHGNPLIVKGKTHGMSKTPLFNRWKQIKRKTTKPKATGYKNYGGRGIKMCDEWMLSFQSFYDYLGEPPTLKHTIERINNDKGYEPGNVKWATYHEQMINKRIFSKRNKWGMVGVYKVRNTFYSQISLNKKSLYLGSFKTKKEARNAYLKARKKYYEI